MKLQLLLATAVVLGSAMPAFGHHLRYTADLTGLAVSPENHSPAIGHVVVTIDFDLVTMQIETEFAGLQGAVTEAHIHAPTSEPLAGIAEAATQVPTLLNFPSSVTSGSYDHLFDLSQSSSYNPAFIAASGGLPGDALDTLSTALGQGTAYFDIHTSAYPNGEIRGFLVYRLGDYNDNGVVDAADYVLWRKTKGVTGEGLQADSDNSNAIDEADYTAWRENFGNAGISTPLGDGATFTTTTTIPEPRTITLMTLALLAPSRRARPA